MSPEEEESSVSSSESPTNSSNTSLQTEISLQTLPSLPSLQRNHLDLSAAIAAIHSFPQTNLPITCLAVHSNLLFSASEHRISVYDHRKLLESADIAPIESFSGVNGGSVKAVAFCGGKVFTAHQDMKIRVWKKKKKKKKKKRDCYEVVSELPSFGDRLRRFAMPKSYVSVRRHVKRMWIEHVDAVSALAAHGHFVYSVSWDRSLKVWRASDLRCLESVDKAHDDAINAVVVSPTGNYIYTGSSDRRIKVWDRKRLFSLVATLEKHRSAINALALSRDGSVLFSGSRDRSILVWEREDSACHVAVAGALRGHRGSILSLSFLAVSDVLISGSEDRTVRIWRRSYGDGDGAAGYLCLGVLEGHARPVKSVVAVSDVDDGVLTVFSGDLDGEVKVWKVSLGLALANYEKV